MPMSSMKSLAGAAVVGSVALGTPGSVNGLQLRPVQGRVTHYHQWHRGATPQSRAANADRNPVLGLFGKKEPPQKRDPCFDWEGRVWRICGWYLDTDTGRKLWRKLDTKIEHDLRDPTLVYKEKHRPNSNPPGQIWTVWEQKLWDEFRNMPQHTHGDLKGLHLGHSLRVKQDYEWRRQSLRDPVGHTTFKPNPSRPVFWSLLAPGTISITGTPTGTPTPSPPPSAPNSEDNDGQNTPPRSDSPTPEERAARTPKRAEPQVEDKETKAKAEAWREAERQAAVRRHEEAQRNWEKRAKDEDLTALWKDVRYVNQLGSFWRKIHGLNLWKFTDIQDKFEWLQKKFEDTLSQHLYAEYDRQFKVNRQLDFAFAANTYQVDVAAKSETEAERELAITALSAAQATLDADLGDLKELRSIRGMLLKHSHREYETLQLVMGKKILPKLSHTSVWYSKNAGSSFSDEKNVLDALNYLATAKTVWEPSKINGDGDFKAAIKLTAYADAVQKFVNTHYSQVMRKVESLQAEKWKRLAQIAAARKHAELHTPSHFLVRGAKGLANLTTLRQRNQGLRHHSAATAAEHQQLQ